MLVAQGLRQGFKANDGGNEHIGGAVLECFIHETLLLKNCKTLQ